jgi:hypothetical protein
MAEVKEAPQEPDLHVRPPGGPTLFAGLSQHVDLKLVSRLSFGSGGGGDALRAEKVAIEQDVII